MIAIPGHLRPVLEAPLGVTGGVNALGRSLGLYLTLVLRANDRGITIRARQRLADDLHASEADIDSWVERLVAAKLIEVQSPAPFLVISFRSWPRNPSVTVNLKSPAAGNSDAAEAAVASQQAYLSKQGDEGPGEGDAIFAELRGLLGEADAVDLRSVIAGYPQALVLRALERVKATPGRQIKKSRTALFRFLLKTLSNDLHDHPPAIQLEP